MTHMSILRLIAIYTTSSSAYSCNWFIKYERWFLLESSLARSNINSVLFTGEIQSGRSLVNQQAAKVDFSQIGRSLKWLTTTLIKDELFYGPFQDRLFLLTVLFCWPSIFAERSISLMTNQTVRYTIKLPDRVSKWNSKWTIISENEDTARIDCLGIGRWPSYGP